MVERNFFWILAYSILVIAKVLSTLNCIIGFYGFCINNKNREYGVHFTRKGPKTVSEMLKKLRIKR